jgi:DNA-binding SARP family transcriptional activator/streptogramin lyase
MGLVRLLRDAEVRSHPGHEDAIDVRILGPLEVSVRGQPLDVGGGKQRALLALLLLRAGEVVSTDRLIDALWEDRPPASALNSVHVYVSQLRKALGDGRLQTREHGYLLALAPEQVDLGRFERLLGEGRELLAGGEAERAAETLTAALALWRGPPLSDFESAPFAQDEIARLEELHVACLEERIEADLARGRHSELIPELEALVSRHPLRERLRAQLMLALYRSGRQSEALAAYQQARRMLAEELGLEPGRDLHELEGAILRQDARLDAPARARTRAGGPRRRGVLVAIGAVLVLSAATAIGGMALTGDDDAGPPEVLPNSLVRIDPSTLKPTDVVQIGDAPDHLVVAGGFVWVVHHMLRDTDSSDLRDAGDRALTRVDTSTGEVRVLGGGLAPCGLAADPSGDVWVANCFASRSGLAANVVRVDAATLEFEATWRLPPGEGFFRGLAHGGGSLWVSDVFGPLGLPKRHRVTQVNPQTGAQRSIPLAEPAVGLSWSGAYGDLWMSNFDVGSVSRLHPASRVVTTFRGDAVNPSFNLVDGDMVWVADWAAPQVVRLHAAGAGRPETVRLPVNNGEAGVWRLAAGAGAIWATTPRDGALWRIDPKTDAVKRIPMPYLPTGVAADDDDVWVTVRAE